MFSITMRSKKGVTTVTATDQDTGFFKKESFSNSGDAFEALREWEKEAQKLQEEQPATAYGLFTFSPPAEREHAT